MSKYQEFTLNKIYNALNFLGLEQQFEEFL